MALDKKDFAQIEKIVQGTEGRLEKKIDQVEPRLNRKIDKTAISLNEKIDKTENRIIAVVSREVTDLAEINRAVIERVDKISELEKRIIRIEHKIGIAG